jgi:hypothetical protein
VDVVVDYLKLLILSVMKIVISLTTAEILARMMMSDGGSRKALTPISTPKLKMEMMSMMGP